MVYIADYPEQALAACIVQGWCPWYGICLIFVSCQSYMSYRCTANRNNLNGGGGQHCHEHTELIVSEFELGVLWDEYGVIGDIVVCSNFILISQY